MISYSVMELCFAQVLEICPYYFALEDKFLERAVIKPSTTTDEIFGDDDIAFFSLTIV